MKNHLIIFTAILLVALIHGGSSTTYQVGVGIADITGPAAEVNMMGYAHPEQITAGIHTRQFSRTFIIEDELTRVVFVTSDCGMIDQVIKFEVVKRLQDKFGGQYTAKNVLLSGTHTHSGPGGFLQYVTYLITSKGWVQQSFESLVNGIVASIDMAHNNMKPANIYYSKGIVVDANINRSPAAYLNNPSWERAKYTYNTDKDLVQLKFVTPEGEPFAVLNWYAAHQTSMNNTNRFISSDNMGYAMLRFEAEMNGPDVMPGKGPFIAAFASSNLGDVSPNTMGAKCLDTGLPCDFVHGTCNNRSQLCAGVGPGKDMVDSTRIIGTKLFDKAWELFQKDNAELELLDGPVQFAHQYVDMPKLTVEVPDETGTGTQTVSLCKAALGYSFASGCSDGAGFFDFTQGDTSGNPFWNTVVENIKPPSELQKQCQHPKPILLDTGDVEVPYKWHPDIVESQVLRIGQVFIAGMPGEFTTMAGRRFREALNLAASSADGGPSNATTIIAGLSNVYSHYITTFEEYQVQRYEGASTLYGPHTLSGYIAQYRKIVLNMIEMKPISDGTPPTNYLDVQISFDRGVVFDKPAYGRQFGDVLRQPYPLIYRGETVSATFVSGHPRNNLMTEGTFMSVEMKMGDGTWKLIRTDAHFDTWFHWRRTGRGESLVETRWDVPADAEEGEYRFKHYGHWKSLDGTILPYSGTSESFKIGGNQ